MQSEYWRWQGKFNIMIHVLAWIAFLSLPILFIDKDQIAIGYIIQRWELWFFAGCFIIPYYLSAYIWTPYIIRNRKYMLYVGSLVLTGILFALWLRPFDRLLKKRKETDTAQRAPFQNNFERPPFLQSQLKPHHVPPLERGKLLRMDIASVYIVALVIILASLFRLLEYWIKSQQKVSDVRHELTKSELAFFKAQVHPHFLFNTLNNIYSLALIGDSSTAASIHKLSQLMRYYMDDRNNQEVDLQDEISAIKDFISLQKLRIGENCTLTERYDLGASQKKIYPFILFPFVENAFKYGLRATQPCYLDFQIRVSQEHCILEIRNSISPDLPDQPSFGIGLRNTKKLLDSLYANKFDLTIEDKDQEFFIKLILYI